MHDVRQTLEEHDKKMLCPKCKTEMEQIFNAIPFVLKDGGVGWNSGGRSK